ncbi:MAG TPA: SUMF1/EgtB/PvdO family nonheme iron enzyme [Pirellulales bacterium]|nr:SUMF1/EgtB/PvdO family nonheme iron enzyme [Pirellulales bacterium]
MTAALVVCGLMAALLAPAVAKSREAARRRQCAENLRAIGVALRQYHDVHGTLPPAAVWQPGTLNTLLLYEVKRFDRTVHQNWAQLLLPYLGRTDLTAQFDPRQPVMAAANRAARETQVAEFTCPSDNFNGPHNLYGFQPWDDRPPLAEFARGNYAINGGSHSIKYLSESTTQSRGESMQLALDRERRAFEAIGTGVAGINHGFRLSDFANGQSTLVAVDEVRAGVHSLDMRGVWALGHIGSSITWAHGVVGDACGPNNQWERSDDIFDCGRLHKAVGSQQLEQWGMPCAWYIDHSQEATARSQHPGGVHVLFVDGAARFVGDDVDRGLWHVMHSRETPAEVLEGSGTDAELVSEAVRPHPNLLAEGEGEPPAHLRVPLAKRKTPPAHVGVPLAKNQTSPEPFSEPAAGERFTNSLGMQFVGIPAGTFTMGVPDVGNDAPAPPECPPHEVKLSRAFWLGVREVTQGQYQAVMGSNPSEHAAGADGDEPRDDFPVENVTWYDAHEFCRRLGDLPDEQAGRRHYRLPTEAEWEYACRSGKSEPYRWNARRPPGDKSGDAAGIEPPLPLAPVGSFPPNAFGLFDMRGNVWEWCADWFDRSYYSRSPLTDPQGPANGYLKVVRGGDWIFVGEVCRIDYPIMSPWQRSPFVGLRVVCEVQDQ